MVDPRPTSDPCGIDLTNPESFRNGFPHEHFARLRRDAPVSWQPFPATTTETTDAGFWVLSRYADVQAANRDTELFSARDGPSLADNPEMRGQMLVTLDGRPDLRQRRLISAGFTPRMVGRLE
jgi:cholest-4-en-3-one 26-monooxygenase